MKLDLSTIVRAEVRLEGESNRNWTLHTQGGKKYEFYSIEGSPQYGDDQLARYDSRVYDCDEPLAQWLDDVSYNLNPSPGDDAEIRDSVTEFTVDVERSLVYNISIEWLESEGGPNKLDDVYKLRDIPLHNMQTLLAMTKTTADRTAVAAEIKKRERELAAHPELLKPEFRLDYVNTFTWEVTDSRLFIAKKTFSSAQALANLLLFCFAKDVHKFLKARDPAFYEAMGSKDDLDWFAMGSESLYEWGLKFTWVCFDNSCTLTVE